MNDYPEGISLDSETYSALTKTIQRDCRVCLTRQHVAKFNASIAQG